MRDARRTTPYLVAGDHHRYDGSDPWWTLRFEGQAPAEPYRPAALERTGREARAAGGASLLVFYDLGHSDGQQVFPRGEALALADLRDGVAKADARVRVAILDMAAATAAGRSTVDAWPAPGNAAARYNEVRARRRGAVSRRRAGASAARRG